MELTKEQEKEFAIWLDLADIRAFIQDNQKEYELWLKQEEQIKNGKLIFGTYIISAKISALHTQNRYEIYNIKMVL